MSNMRLLPELNQLFDDFLYVRERFEGLADAFVKQQVVVQSQKNEILNLTETISFLEKKRLEDEHIIRAYNQLRTDYDLLNSTTENHRIEIHNANIKRVQDLEEELKAVKAKLSQQSDLHKSNIAEYQAKLNAANEKIRELNYKIRIETSRPIRGYENTEDISPKLFSGTKAVCGKNKRFPQLNVELAPRGSRSRGRGKSRGGGNKRKLFKLNEDEVTDLS